MRKILLLIPLLSLISSCAMYKQEFDCPPPQGVPCTSETDLEAMIMETDQGADLFLPYENDKLFCSKQNSTPVERVCATLGRKVWVCDQLTQDGYIQGHYIYQTNSQTISTLSNERSNS
ncbi:MAG: hypothetical protein ACHQUC_01070 [Chlamydiales bacterium]